MRFLLADSFTSALARLPAQEARAVKTTVVDLQIDPTGKGLSFHRIDKSKDPNFWSVRVSRELRLIVHKTEDSLLVAYVDHHDRAYAWAERRRIEAHPSTGAIQIVELRERVEEVAVALPLNPAFAVRSSDEEAQLLFASLGDDALLSVGVPADWLAEVRMATENSFFDVAAHLPTQASEALLQYATVGILPPPPAPVGADPYVHPDAQRHIRLIVGEEELRQALDYPWERWGVFLHPSQRAVVERRFAGPARVSGSAGTGKTVVALHRAVRLARANSNARVLLTTFSAPLARSLTEKLAVLAPETGGIVPRITVADWYAAADELFQLIHGRRPRIVSPDALRGTIASAAAEVRGFTPRFLLSEWTNVIDAWGIDGLEQYTTVPRLGRRSPLGPRQRERLWSAFERVGAALREQDVFTRAGVCRDVAAHYAAQEIKPFSHIVVDEAQDLGPAELVFLAAIAPPGDDGLFFAGDIGQRIFQHPFSWKALGIEVRGRSANLKVCYRTSRQIRSVADRLLPGALRDPDGNEEERAGTISVFEGPAPDVMVLVDARGETEKVTDFLRTAISDGIRPNEIGVFVRSPDVIGRARAAVEAAGLDEEVASVMHLAKGLEFRAVVVMACDQELLPLEARIAEAAGEGELDDIYETERQLLYVACTRARERLLVTGVAPGSEFLKDL